MEILGVGGAELIVILLLMLVIGGPKRMLQWAYVAGEYAGKLRLMWRDVMSQVQAELDQAGVGVQVPKDLPTRASLNRSLNQHAAKALKPYTAPLQQTMDQVRREVALTPQTAPQPTPVDEQPVDLGAWSPPDEQAS